eukprot:403348622
MTQTQSKFSAKYNLENSSNKNLIFGGGDGSQNNKYSIAQQYMGNSINEAFANISNNQQKGLQKSVVGSANEGYQRNNQGQYIFLFTQQNLDKLYWYCNRFPPKNISNSFFFNIDEILIYNGYNKDFGPLSLAQVHRFCTELKRIMRDEKFKSDKIFHHCSPHFQKQTNACFLMGAFMIVCFGKTAEEAWHPFKHLELVAFKDAGEEPSSYECTVIDCLRGLEKAISFSWYNYLKFDYKEYEFNHKLDNGDMNWIVPNKILALSSPTDNPSQGLPPSEFIEQFKKMKVTAVIRLNEQLYDEGAFEKHGIKVYDMEFMDGSCPDDSTIMTFLSIVDAENKLGGAVAVHCRAGLGRTGTLIAAYIMNKFNFESRSLLGWLRISRPGSVIGQQQQFLVDSFQRIRQMQIQQLSGKSLRTFNQFQDGLRSSVVKEDGIRQINKAGGSYISRLIQQRAESQTFYQSTISRFDKNQEEPKNTCEQQVRQKFNTNVTTSEQNLNYKYNTGKSCQGEQLMEKRKKKLSSYMNVIDKMLEKDKLAKAKY